MGNPIRNLIIVFIVSWKLTEWYPTSCPKEEKRDPWLGGRNGNHIVRAGSVWGHFEKEETNLSMEFDSRAAADEFIATLPDPVYLGIFQMKISDLTINQVHE